jgi:protein gp37
MGEQTGIQWTDHTWNPWYGCVHVSEGCFNCYMFREQVRYGRNPAIVNRAQPPTFNSPLKWKTGRVFTCSWSDFFISDADAWRDEAWEIIRRTPHLTYQILTKRPARIERRLPKDWGNGWPNVWLGVSVENQAMAENRIPVLIDAAAAVKFLSVEPLLEPVSLRKWLAPEWASISPLDWIIVGGESGPEARECKIWWISDVVAQAKAGDVPVFVKQLGTISDWRDEGKPRFKSWKGDNPEEWPDHLRNQRNFPNETMRRSYTSI